MGLTEKSFLERNEEMGIFKKGHNEKYNQSNDLIPRAAAIRIAERYGCNNGSALGHHSGVADCIASEIAALQAVDAAPVVHGRWISKSEEGVYGPTYCSICDFELRINDTPYCPMCGAKMDDERRVDNAVN